MFIMQQLHNFKIILIIIKFLLLITSEPQIYTVIPLFVYLNMYIYVCLFDSEFITVQCCCVC